MGTVTNLASCVPMGDAQENGLLPINPFTALQFHFGMLLGVDDLETLEGYPRGKMRLHNAWLHREGVVWGYGLKLKAQAGELQVDPGLATDALGHELPLDVAACVSLGAWLDAHLKDFDPPLTPAPDGSVTFDAHVVLKFKACLTRQVPAITDACQQSQQDTAYSRAVETVEILLEPGLGAAKVPPYHRLRLLFELDAPKVTGGTTDPEDQAIVNRREDIKTKPWAQQGALWLQAFREYAAQDTATMAPATSADGTLTLFPEDETTELLLGNVKGVHLTRSSTGWTLASPLPNLDISVRPSHVATAALEELLCRALFIAAASSAGGGGGGTSTPPPDDGSPKVNPASVSLTKSTLTFSVSRALVPSTVDPSAFWVSTFSEDEGWEAIGIKKASVDAAGTTVTLELKEAPQGDWVRLVARGTGPAPLLGAVGTGYLPLQSGEDFTTQWKRS